MNTFTFWLWFGICIASIVLEIATVSALVSIWFALGAVAALGAYFLGASFTIQILVFFVFSVLLVLTIRPFAAKQLRGEAIATNVDSLISMRTHLLREITEDEPGELKARGLIWNPISIDNQPIEKEALVEIVALNGNKVIVRKIK